MSKPKPTEVPGHHFRLNALFRPALGLSILTISALSLGLFTDVSFGASYRVAPRIAPRDRGNLPKVTHEPRIDLESTPPKATPLPSATAAKPVVTSTMPAPANEVPSVTVEISKVAPPPPKPIESQAATTPVFAPVKVLTSQSPQTPASVRPERTNEATKIKTETVAKAEKSRHKAEAKNKKIARGKKSHPIVIAPEPLLPTEIDVRTAGLSGPSDDWSEKAPIPNRSQANKSLATGTAAQPFSSEKSQSGTINASAGGIKTAQYNGSSDMGHAPGQAKRFSTHNGVYSAPSEQTSHANGWESGFYPVGYTPAVRPVTPEKVQQLGEALSHYNRGVYYAQRKQWDAAMQEYKQVISQNGNMADAYVGLSTAAIYQRDWENALKNSVKALRLKHDFMDPANITQARYNLSSVYCVSNDYRKAVKYFKQVKADNHPEADALWTFLQSNCKP